MSNVKRSSPMPSVAAAWGYIAPGEDLRDWGADGAIVGSALVKRMALAEPVAAAQQFCSELRTALDS